MRNRVIRCRRCGLSLPPGEFYRSPSSGRREKECALCKHQRLAALHGREAELIRHRRQRLRDEYAARVEAGRAAAGGD